MGTFKQFLTDKHGGSAVDTQALFGEVPVRRGASPKAAKAS